jgi:hypothetical protein
MKRFVKVSLMLASAAVLLSSCNCYKKMAKNADDVNITCTPTVLSLKGNTVSADITVTYPAAYFNKKAVLKVTPVLVFEGGEITGTPKYVQGEKVKDNYTVIAKKQGGSYTQTVTFPYDSRADLCTMELRVEGKCAKGKHSEFTPIAAIPVAQGISTIQKLADNAAGLAIMPDNFKRVTTISQGAEIMYLINRANVRKGELTKEQIKMFEDFVKEYSNKDRATLGNIYAKGYASPDGPLAFNDKLSKERSQTGQKAISEKLKDVKNAKYDIAAYGEDWEGFKELVSASDIKDKDLILQVLAMYDNPVKRDEEIRNMSSVFDVLAKEILPQLRRTKLSADVDIEGRTDAEILAAVSGNIQRNECFPLYRHIWVAQSPSLLQSRFFRIALEIQLLILLMIYDIAAGSLEALLQSAWKAGIALICFHQQIDSYLLYIVKIRFYRFFIPVIRYRSADFQFIIR